MNTKHTPRPWTAGPASKEGNELAEANAKLIANIPYMLEILEEVYHILHKNKDTINLPPTFNGRTDIVGRLRGVLQDPAI